MKKKLPKNNIVIYQAKSGAIELRGDFEKDTVWATLEQMADVFGRDKSVISRHLKNIYEEKELEEKATIAKNATVQIEGSQMKGLTCSPTRLDDCAPQEWSCRAGVGQVVLPYPSEAFDEGGTKVELLK